MQRTEKEALTWEEHIGNQHWELIQNDKELILNASE